MPEMRPVTNLLRRSAYGLTFGHTKGGKAAAAKIAALPELGSGRQAIRILEILLDLALESEAQSLSTYRMRCHSRVQEQGQIEAICSYLKTHANHSIDSASVARNFNMSQPAICRLFKRSTGSTMTSYLNEIRVDAAEEMLRKTDRTALEISFSVGFGNHSNFNRQFRRIKGYSPRAARQQAWS